MSILLDEIVGSDPLDRFSFDLDGLFKNQNISDKEFSAFRIGWLSNMNGEYNIEKEILEICENKLRELEKININPIVPNAKGRMTPAIATVKACAPTATNSSNSLSRPVKNSNAYKPNVATACKEGKASKYRSGTASGGTAAIELMKLTKP